MISVSYLSVCKKKNPEEDNKVCLILLVFLLKKANKLIKLNLNVYYIYICI